MAVAVGTEQSEVAEFVAAAVAERDPMVDLEAARTMGTSVSMIDQTYGHLLPDSEEYLRGLLDNYA
jgi:hypothetical protein